MTYDASSISVLPGMEAVRQQPAMYVGSTGTDGLHHLVYEVVENAIDESMAGFCSAIQVEIHDDGSVSVTDNGRGIPVDAHPSDGRPACEVVLTTLHAGGKFNGNSYGLTGGLHGVGLSCVNALSAWLRMDIWREGAHHQQQFSRGEATSSLEVLGEAERQGTRIHFLPDNEIFSDVTLSFDRLHNRLQELAFLHPGVGITIREAGTGRSDSFQYDTGIRGFVEHLNQSKVPLHPEPIHIQDASNGVQIDAALQWTTAYSEDITSFANSIHTSQGGTHEVGLRSALTRAANQYASRTQLLNAENGERIKGFDVREGLTCVLSIKIPEPQFEGQTKSLLSSPGVSESVESVLMNGLETYLDAHPKEAAQIVGKALEASRARNAARRASERARYQFIDPGASEEVYQAQFGIRSKNWHESCSWLADEGLLEKHAAMCKVGEDARMLDVCCGSGIVGASFGDRVAHKTGLDLTPEMRSMASTRLDEVKAGTIYKLPFEDGTFDLTVTREVLHLLPNPEKPVSEIFRVLKPGGQFVVGQILPYGADDAAWMFRIFRKKQPLFFNNFQEADFRALLEDAGFRDLEMEEYLLWESIDLWIDTHETTSLHRHEIRDLFYNAPREARDIHPFEILPNGEIRDQWRWCIFSARKPA